MNYYFKVLQNYVTFTGRARRKEYWMFVLFNVIIAIILGIIDRVIGSYNYETRQGLFSNLYSLAILLPSIAVGIRRMHDVGKSGWFMLIPIYDLILACTEGDKGDNKYGADPKANV